jgi:hypothetical protein
MPQNMRRDPPGMLGEVPGHGLGEAGPDRVLGDPGADRPGVAPFGGGQAARVNVRENTTLSSSAVRPQDLPCASSGSPARAW